MKLISMLIIIIITATMPLLLSFALQLSVKMTPGTIIAYASTNVTGNNETEDVPHLVSTPPPLLPSIDKTGDADVNGTNTTLVRQPTGNYTNNGTALATEGLRQIIQSNSTGNNTSGREPITEGPRQIITSTAESPITTQNQLGQIITDQSASTGQNIPPTQPGQIMDGVSVADIANMNITKENAAKAEQEANVMLEAYNENVKREKALEEGQTNQTTQSSNTSSTQTCLGGELSVQIEKSTVCLSPYEISIACNPGGSLFGDPICTSAGTSSMQQSLGEEEVIDETGGPGGEESGGGEEVIEEGAGEEPGGGEEEVIEEGDAGEQEVIEDFQ